MKILKEFKEFAMRGNVIDLAVGVIIGGAFGKIVTSFVNDIVMPPIGYLIHGIDFKALKVVLHTGANGTPDASLNYGSFIQNLVEFIIIAAVVFLMVKMINKLKRKKEEKPAEQPVVNKQEQLLAEIRDLLKAKK